MTHGWDARFRIAIFPDGQWCKLHTFSGGKRPDRHCLSAVEGLDGAAQDVALIGRTTEIERRTTKDVGLVVDARDRFHWIRIPRVLTYFSETGAAKVTVDGVTRDAFGISEEAWGAQTRIDVARLAPRRWQWDVVSFGGDRFAAALTFWGRGIRATARLAPSGGLVPVSRVRIRTLKPGIRWTGTMRIDHAVLEYEANAATPIAPEVDCGGFVGFTWYGTLDGQAVTGGGFSEYRHA